MSFLKLAKKNGDVAAAYESEIVNRIRSKYSLDQELAILRQRDTKPEEFAAYNDFAEQCKSEVKKELGGN